MSSMLLTPCWVAAVTATHRPAGTLLLENGVQHERQITFLSLQKPNILQGQAKFFLLPVLLHLVRIAKKPSSRQELIGGGQAAKLPALGCRAGTCVCCNHVPHLVAATAHSPPARDSSPFPAPDVPAQPSGRPCRPLVGA